jgi:hypothetical protein
MTSPVITIPAVATPSPTTGKLVGGVVTGYIKNQGTMLNFEFKGMSIMGGTLGGVIRNTSQVGGYFQDVTLQANTKITGWDPER